MAASGAISGAPFFTAWVIGQTLAHGVGGDKVLQRDNAAYGRVRATTYGTLVDTANRRLFKLRDVLGTRYAHVPTDPLVARVLDSPEQGKLDVTVSSKPGEAA